MKAYQIAGQFGVEHLALAELPEPKPGPGEVAVRVRAVSLNYRDLSTVLGTYNPKLKMPLIPCSDGAGEVVAVGAGVGSVKAGDRVTSVFAPNWVSGEPTKARLAGTLGGPVDGMLAEVRVLPEAAVAPMPGHLSFEEAATLPCAAVTAWRALVTEGQVKPGDVVVLQGTGGVSLFGLQIAKLLGARAILTSSQDAKLERGRKLGADATINYKDNPEWHKEVRAHTRDVGADHIVEVGGAATLERSLQAVRVGGRISVIGVLSGRSAPVNLTSILMRSVRLQGLLVGCRDDLLAMNRAFELAKVKPVVDRVFGFEEAKAAFAHMASGGHFGKIVVKV